MDGPKGLSHRPPSLGGSLFFERHLSCNVPVFVDVLEDRPAVDISIDMLNLAAAAQPLPSIPNGDNGAEDNDRPRTARQTA